MLFKAKQLMKVKFGEEESPFGCLPLEMVAPIMNYLPNCDKNSCRLVCHRWNYVLSNFCDTCALHPTLNNKSLKYILMSNEKLDCVLIEGLNKRLPRMSSSKNKFGNIKNVIIGEKNSKAAIVKVMKYGLEYTNFLELRSESLKAVGKYDISRTLQKCKWDYLTKLNLTVELKKNKNHFQACSNFIKSAKIPNLLDFTFCYKHIKFIFEDINFINFENIEEIKCPAVQFQRLFLFLYEFLGGHAQTLKKLQYRIAMDWFRMGYELPNLPESRVLNMKIENFSFHLNGSFVGFEYLVTPTLIGSELKCFEIDTSTHDIDIISNLHQIFESNAKSLENIKINTTTWDTSLLKHCPSLKSLILYACDLTLPVDGVIYHPDVKDLNLEVNILTQSSILVYEQLFIQTQGKIEQLDIFVDWNVRIIDWDWLISCANLKHLTLEMEYENFDMVTEFDVYFPNLVELECYYQNYKIQNQTKLFTWIENGMCNLQIFEMVPFYSSLFHLQILFRMKKLKKIYFGVIPNEEEERIIKHCNETPGLNFSRTKLCYTKKHNYEFHIFPKYTPGYIIKIDRHIFIPSV